MAGWHVAAREHLHFRRPPFGRMCKCVCAFTDAPSMRNARKWRKHVTQSCNLLCSSIVRRSAIYCDAFYVLGRFFSFLISYCNKNVESLQFILCVDTQSLSSLDSLAESDASPMIRPVETIRNRLDCAALHWRGVRNRSFISFHKHLTWRTSESDL